MGRKVVKFYKNLENKKNCKKHRKNRWKSIKTLILEELGINGRHHQILREKLLYIDLFSCLYDRKWSKTLPVHVRKRSYVSVHNCMNACVFYELVLHIGAVTLRTYERLNERTNARIFFTYGLTNLRTNEQTNKRTNERT